MFSFLLPWSQALSFLLFYYIIWLLYCIFFVAAAVLFLFAKYNPIFLHPYIHLHIFFCWWCRWIKIRIVNKVYDLFICKILYIFTSPHRFMTELVCNFFPASTSNSTEMMTFEWVLATEKKKSTAITSTRWDKEVICQSLLRIVSHSEEVYTLVERLIFYT